MRISFKFIPNIYNLDIIDWCKYYCIIIAVTISPIQNVKSIKIWKT